MISKEEVQRINEIIAQAEKKTRSEIIPMVISHSDNYPAAHWRSAIFFSFIFSLALYFSPLSIINPIYYLWIQIPGLIVGYLLANIEFIERIFITKDEMETEVHQRALEAFFEHNLHATKKRKGVLVFISLLERKIRIVADIEVNKKIEQKVWDEIIAEFGNDVKKTNLLYALEHVIELTSNVLEHHFPKDANNQSENELNNDVIIG